MEKLESKMKEHIFIFSKVKYPQMRQILMYSLQNLSDKEIQLKEWLSSKDLYKAWFNILDEWDVLDSFNLTEDPEETIGEILVDKKECQIVQPVYQTLDDVCEKIGEKQSDSAYINSPLWDEVVEAAGAALKVFLKNEEEAKKINPHPWNGEDNWGDDPAPDSAPKQK